MTQLPHHVANTHILLESIKPLQIECPFLETVTRQAPPEERGSPFGLFKFFLDARRPKRDWNC